MDAMKGWGTVQGAPRQRDGWELVGGVAEEEDVVTLLTCDVAQFETHLAAQYPDWTAFQAWAEERRLTRTLASGHGDHWARTPLAVLPTAGDAAGEAVGHE